MRKVIWPKATQRASREAGSCVRDIVDGQILAIGLSPQYNLRQQHQQCTELEHQRNYVAISLLGATTDRDGAFEPALQLSRSVSGRNLKRLP
jgi:hypothetical protein